MKVRVKFNMQCIRSDENKYDLVVSFLDLDIIQEMADVLLSPPETGRYVHLKAAIINRLTDSSDR